MYTIIAVVAVVAEEVDLSTRMLLTVITLAAIVLFTRIPLTVVPALVPPRSYILFLEITAVWLLTEIPTTAAAPEVVIGSTMFCETVKGPKAEFDEPIEMPVIAAPPVMLLTVFEE